MGIKVVVTEKEILNITNDDELGRWVRKEFWKLADNKLYDNDIEYDHCRICGKQSPYTKNTHTSERIGYIDGGGQGCFTPNKCDKI
jgi:hypothetical protein